jgi:hypothetical protein
MINHISDELVVPSVADMLANGSEFPLGTR